VTRAAIIELTRTLGPLTTKQIGIERGISASTARQNVRRARAYGSQFLRIAGWVGGLPLYGPGPAPDNLDGGRTSDRIMALLEFGGPLTSAQVTKRLADLPSTSVWRAIHRLRELKKIHVFDYKRRVNTPGREAIIWAAGKGQDKPRPDFSERHHEADRRRRGKNRVKRAMEARQAAR
jgi:hypothetical protein